MTNCVNEPQVTYCETEKKGEVLQLMAGMMVRRFSFIIALLVVIY